MEVQMSRIDLNALGLAELKQLAKDVSKAISGFEDRKKSEARAALEAQAKELGFTLSELLGAGGSKTRSPTVARYRHPENASITWSGRGRKPHWFSDAIAKGVSPESLAV
jgi:DNA-binding protein H-NS